MKLIKCKMVAVPRWTYDSNGLATYSGFYLPVPLEPGESEIGSVECTETYIAAMNKLVEIKQ